MAKKRKRRQLPRLDTSVLQDDDTLTRALDELLRHSRRLRCHCRKILRRQSALRARVDARTWRALLELEETQVARFSDSLDLVARWAFAAGLRIGRQRPR